MNVIIIIVINRFMTKSRDRKQHINNIHSTEKLLKCLFENCHKLYGNKKYLTRHLKTSHERG